MVCCDVPHYLRCAAIAGASATNGVRVHLHTQSSQWNHQQRHNHDHALPCCCCDVTEPEAVDAAVAVASLLVTEDGK
jgi:hypothetical protein